MKSIDYICYSGSTGYAFAAKNTIKALQSENIKINICDIRDKHEFTSDFVLYHCLPDQQLKHKTKLPQIGYATFEASVLPPHWKAYINMNKFIIVPSRFNQAMVENAGFKNVIYVPHCLNFDEYNENVVPSKKFDNRFHFLTMGTWKERKNHKEVICGFLKEFNDLEATLTIKTSQIGHTSVVNAVAEIAKKLGKKYSHIIVNTNDLRDCEIPSFMKNYNAFISASLGEGFGLTGFQAMALKVPTILTFYSGMTDYTNDENCYKLLPERFLKRDLDGLIQFQKQLWPVIGSEQIGSQMRKCFNENELRDKKAEIAYLEIGEKFNYKNSVKELIELL